MLLPVSRRAERFAAALDGDASIDDAATQRLVGTAARLGSLRVAVPARAGAGRLAVVAAASGLLAEAAKHAAAPAVHAAASTGYASTSYASPVAAAAPTASTASTASTLAHVVGHTAVLKAVTGIAALAVLGAGVEAAAQRSVPGQPFYGLKRVTESAQLHLSGGDAAQARERLDQAKARLAEIQALWPTTPSAARSQQIADLITALDKDVALATGPLLAAGGAAAADLRAAVIELQTELAALPRTLQGPGAAAVATSVALLGSLTTAVSGLPTLVPGPGPTGAVAPAPTQPVQVLPTTAPVVPTTVPTSPRVPTSPTTRPSPTSLPTGPSGILPTLTAPPISVPSFGGPAALGPPAAPVPSPVASVVCGLLHMVVSCPS